MFRRGGIRLGLILGDMTTVALALFLASWLRPQLGFGYPLAPVNTRLGWPIYIIAIMVWAVTFLLIDVYNLQKNLRLVDEWQRLVVAHIASSLAFAGVLYFSFRDISRLQTLSFTLLALILLMFFRATFRLFLHLFGDKRYGTRRVLIVGAGSVGRGVADMVVRHYWTGLRLVGFVDDNPQADTLQFPHFGSLEQTVDTVRTQHINEIIFALPREAHLKLANLVVALQSLQVNVRVVPDFFDLVFLRFVVEDVGDMPLVTLREPVLDPLQRFIKRIFDLITATVGLVLSLPFMAVITLAIRLDSAGPIIFKQHRVGENGKLFNMYKFRTMYQDLQREADELPQILVDGQPVHKLYDDPRVTKVGRFLRRTSLDELPQFINILKGDMSLVGPRPELPWLVDKYEPWQRKRFEVPQGLTGWWQVNGRADKPMHLHTEDDLYYIKNYSLWLDIQILWRTLKAVVERRGAY